MKSIRPWLCIVLMTMLVDLAFAAPDDQDPLSTVLFPPELLIQHREEIGLTETQVQRIHEHARNTGVNGKQHQVQANKAKRQLASLLSAEPVNEEAALKKLDEVHTIERKMQRLHLRLMIQIRNELNPQQLRVAERIKEKPRRDRDRQQRLKAKISRMERGAGKMQQEGADVSQIRESMRKIGPLLQQGKLEDAEKLIDEALKLTTENAAPDASTPRSPENLRAEVQALNKEDVAWRKIQWKTCLLDGLQASRAQNKPIMLWIFIDRPIDDERC